MNEGIRGVQKARAETNRLYHKERTKRAGELARLQPQPAGPGTLPKELSALKGELPKKKYEPVKLEENELYQLFDMANQSSKIGQYEKLGVKKAIADMVEGIRLPGVYEIGLIEKVYGTDTAKSILAIQSGWEKGYRFAVDAANVPRALMSSFDMSAPLRQGAVLSAAHPKESAKAFGQTHKNFFSDKDFEVGSHSDTVLISPNWGRQTPPGGWMRPEGVRYRMNV